MGVFNGVFPIQAGKEDASRAFAAETIGARRAGFDAQLARGDISRETWRCRRPRWGASCSCGSKAM
jgi:hypothetical protein